MKQFYRIYYNEKVTGKLVEELKINFLMKKHDSQIKIDTLDLSHIFGYIDYLKLEINRINNIPYIDNRTRQLEINNYWLKNDNKVYKQRIDKVIEKLKGEIEHCDRALSNPEYTIVSKHNLLKYMKKCCIKQLDILQGSDIDER